MNKKLDPVVFYDNELRRYNRIIIIALVFITIGTLFYHWVEKLSWLDSVYFTVITLATVGYGDIVPQTVPGKVFTILYIIVGITIFVTLANTIVKRYIYKKESRKNKQRGA